MFGNKKALACVGLNASFTSAESEVGGTGVLLAGSRKADLKSLAKEARQ